MPISLLSCQASIAVLEFMSQTSLDSFPPGILSWTLPVMGCIAVQEPGFSITGGEIAPFPVLLPNDTGGAQPCIVITWEPGKPHPHPPEAFVKLLCSAALSLPQ